MIKKILKENNLSLEHYKEPEEYKEYEKDEHGNEYWYDKDCNLIRKKFSDGDEIWFEYDKNGNLIHQKFSNGDEVWYEYDKEDNILNKLKRMDGIFYLNDKEVNKKC